MPGAVNIEVEMALFGNGTSLGLKLDDPRVSGRALSGFRMPFSSHDASLGLRIPKST